MKRPFERLRYESGKPGKAAAYLSPGLYFSLLYFLNMSSRALFTPFSTVYLQEKGMQAGQIGWVMAISSLVIILAQPLWGMAADRAQAPGRVLACCFLLQAAVVFSFQAVFSPVLVGLSFCLSTFFSAPEGPLMDAWALDGLKRTGNSRGLGQIKFWGCAGYALLSSLSGRIIGRTSVTGITPVFAILLFCVGLLVLCAGKPGEGRRQTKQKPAPLRLLLQNRMLLLFLCYLILMQIPHRAAYTFYPLLIEELGGGSEMVGYTSAVMFVSEAVMMVLSKPLLKRMKPLQMVMLSSGFFALWQLIYSMVTRPWQVAACALLDGPSFALLGIGVLYSIDELAPKEMRSTCQALAYACYFGISGILGNAAGGWILPRTSYRGMYLCGFLLILLAHLLLISGRRLRFFAKER